ncbi:MAG: immunoglobulin-like domain-containing protein [bacterium]
MIQTDKKVIAIFVFLFVFIILLSNTQPVQAVSDGSVVTLHVAGALIPPMIVLNGQNPFDISVGDVFIEPGAVATDTEGENISNMVVITGGVNNGPVVNTSIAGTTTLVYSVTDPNNGLSTSVTRIVVVHPIVVPEPGPQPVFPAEGSTSSGGSKAFSSQQSFTPISISNFRVMVTLSSVTMQWTSNLAAVSTFSWGVDPDATAGSLSEITPSTHHNITLDSLRPGITYYVVVHMNSVQGATNYFLYSFVTLPRIGHSIPPNVISFSSHESAAGEAMLDWVNASTTVDPRVVGVRITRGTRYFPRDPDEGYLVYEGASSQYEDLSVAKGITYYYTIFTKNNVGDYSSGVTNLYVPAPLNLVFSDAPLFGGEITRLSTTTLQSVIFIQNKKTLTAPNGEVTIVPDAALTVDIPPGIIPKYTEEIIMEFPNANLLFQSLANGWEQMVVPAGFAYQYQTPFTIHFLAIGVDSRLEGVFAVPDLAAKVATSSLQVPSNDVPARQPLLVLFYASILIAFFLTRVL